MAVQMDKPSELSSRERAQCLYNKNIELENTRRKTAHARIPSDPSVWQQIRENYESIVLEDHSFSEQHEIELALWQLHYKQIEELRALYSGALTSNVSSGIQNGDGSTHPDQFARIRSQFKTFLSEATGFYHELMLKIRAKYGLPLAYFSDDPENQIFLSKDGQKSTDIKKGLISCHRCLIYLGDLARYKGLYGDEESKTRDFAAASSYYMQASSFWPTSGNPHHQLAILAAYHGDEFVAIYRYFRSLAVESPFSTARENLIIAFERNRQNYLQLLGDSKTSKAATPKMTGRVRGRGEARPLPDDTKSQSCQNSKDKTPNIPETFRAFCVKFVRVNGILFTRTSLETFADVLSMAKSDFMALLSSGVEEKYDFGLGVTECGPIIVRLVAILIFTVHNLNRESDNQSYADILQRSVLLQNAYTATFEFMRLIVERCLQLQDPLSSYLLPGVLVFVEWLASHPDVYSDNGVGEEQGNIRLCFWNYCISFLNMLLSSSLIKNDEYRTCVFNMGKYEEGEIANRIALWEDFELRGFLPLHRAHSILDFSWKHSFGNDGTKEKKIRAQRIIAAGKAFANVVRVGQLGLYFDTVTEKFILDAEPRSCTDFALSKDLDMVRINGTGQEQLPEGKTNLGILEPALLMVDGDDEEEVIVFKPSAVDRQADGGCMAFDTCEDLGLVANVSGGDLGVCVQSVSGALDGTLLQSGCELTLGSSTSTTGIATQYSLPTQPSCSGWVVEQYASMESGLKKLCPMDNGNLMNQKFPECLTAALSLPFSHGINPNMVDDYAVQVSDAVIPLKTDFSLSSRDDLEICSVKSQSISPVGSRKNPVSRPVRNVGPPPGFASATSKFNDDLCYESNIKDNPLMDDYSWLDGYQIQASTKQGTGYDNSANLHGLLYSNVGKSSSVIGAMSFPFPGKQTSTVSNKLWQDYQIPDHLTYEQQQPLKGNQQPISLPEYQGRSLWESHFLV